MFGADKKHKRPKEQRLEPDKELSVVLYKDAAAREAMPDDLPNADVWRDGRILRVGSSTYSVLYNPPTVEKVQLLIASNVKKGPTSIAGL